MPRSTEPAGMAVRPLTFTSTSVVPSNRSSTFTVPEFSALVRRTSTSVPEGTSTPVPDVAVGALLRGAADCCAGRLVVVPLLVWLLLVPGEYVVVEALVACERRSSSRSRTPAYSVRCSDPSLRNFTFR